MATIFSRSNKLYIDFVYQGVRCKERTKYIDTAENRKLLAPIVKKLDACITLDTLNYADFFPKSKKVQFFENLGERKSIAFAKTPLFKEFAELWFQEKVVEWKQAQKNKIRDILERNLYPTFGKRPVSEIKKSDLLEFRASLAKENPRNNKPGLSPARINMIMTPLRMILNEAADRYEFLTPYRNIKPVKIPKTNVNPLSLDDVWRFISAVRPDFQNYYKVRFFTGMRTSEIHGLPWKNIDFDRREIVIDQALVEKRIETTKTEGSNRIIQMNSIVYEALQDQKRATGKFQFVFCTGLGNPLDYNNISKRVWFPTLKHLGLERRRPYQTRHTAATLWLAAGEAPEWIARQLGHSSTKMLFQVYSRYVPNLTRQDGSRIEALLTNKNNQQMSLIRRSNMQNMATTHDQHRHELEAMSFGNPIRSLSNPEIWTMAADVCKVLCWGQQERTIVHLLPMRLSAKNIDAVYYWIKCRQQQKTSATTFRGLCEDIYEDLHYKQVEWNCALRHQH